MASYSSGKFDISHHCSLWNLTQEKLSREYMYYYTDSVQIVKNVSHDSSDKRLPQIF